MRIFLTLLLACTALTSSAQTDVLLGYQEFPMHVLGHTSDAQGNMYYTGTFKGELWINNQFLAEGNGLEDVYWVKMSPTGQILKFYTYGSVDGDIALTECLKMGAGNQLYFFLKTFAPMSVGNVSITPYPGPLSAAGITSVVIRTDTSGAVKWARRTNLNVLKIYSQNNLVHVVGSISPSTGAIKSENTIVLDSVGKQGLVHMIYDTSGNYLRSKTITINANNQFISVQSLAGYSDGNLLYTVSLPAVGSVQFHNTSITVPTSGGAIPMLIRTDTSFTNVITKRINQTTQVVTGAGSNTLTATLAANDSLYSVLVNDQGTSVSIDGFSLPAYRNMLVVFDKSLNVRRTADLGPNYVAYHFAGSYKRRIYFRTIALAGNRIYMTGQFTGVNESPLNVIPRRDTTFPILLNATETLDLNGPTKAFIAKTDIGLSTASMKWYGDNSSYEITGVHPAFLHTVNNDKVVFAYSDNTWNPYVVDQNLNVLSGVMGKNSDRPESPQMVSFFPSGSKLIMAFASGRTAFDTGHIRSNSIRRDVFFACINSSGTVKWHKRIHSTLPQATVRKFTMKDGKAWFLTSYVGVSNDSNFIMVNNTPYPVRINASMLGSLDSNGNLIQVNLGQAVYRFGEINDFSFFSNGDLAILFSPNYTLNMPGFSTSPGTYIVRVNPVNGNILDTRKLTATIPPFFHSMEVDGNNAIHLSRYTSNSSTPTIVYLEQLLTRIDSIAVENATGLPHIGIVKMEWSRFSWSRRFTGASGSSNVRILPIMLFINNRLVMPVRGQVTNQPLLWQSQPIHNGVATNAVSLVAIDVNGNMVRSKVLPLFVNMIKKSSNNSIYVSGYNNVPAQFDTISVANAGATDAVSLILDSTFKAKRSFRLATYLSESMYDMDVWQDSIVAFTYFAQITPSFYSNRGITGDRDRDPNAFLSMRNFTTLIVTSLPVVLPPGTSVVVAPNPIVSKQVKLWVNSPISLQSMITIYNAAGQQISTQVVSVRNGMNVYTIYLPKNTSAGTYYLRISNKQWQTTKPIAIYE